MFPLILKMVVVGQLAFSHQVIILELYSHFALTEIFYSIPEKISRETSK